MISRAENSPKYQAARTNRPVGTQSHQDDAVGCYIREDRPHIQNVVGSVPPCYRRVKRYLDVFVAAVICIPAAPIILLGVALVKLTSRGPAFYWQSRLGQHGKIFEICKLRTMVHECERQSGIRWSQPGDPRITFVGQLLRRWHIDELPQLWNVFRGEMSLVGPRPERPEFLTPLQEALVDYARRLDIRPGITGLAQVQLPADSDLESVRRKLNCDLHYIEQESASLDFRLILATAGKLFGIPFVWTAFLLRIPVWSSSGFSGRVESDGPVQSPNSSLSQTADLSW